MLRGSGRKLLLKLSLKWKLIRLLQEGYDEKVRGIFFFQRDGASIVAMLESKIAAGEKIALIHIAKIGKATLSFRDNGSSGGATKATATVGAVEQHHDSISFYLPLCLIIYTLSLSLSLSLSLLSPSPSIFLSNYLSHSLSLPLVVSLIIIPMIIIGYTPLITKVLRVVLRARL